MSNAFLKNCLENKKGQEKEELKDEWKWEEKNEKLNENLNQHSYDFFPLQKPQILTSLQKNKEFDHSNTYLKNKQSQEEELKDEWKWEEKNEKLSENLIKKMMEEEEREHREIMKIKEEIDKERMICQICLEKLLEKDLFLLNNCTDIFHQECIAIYVKNQVK